MYDETNVPGPEYKVRPVIRYLLTVYYHGYKSKDIQGNLLTIDGSSRVVGEFEREEIAEEVRAGMQKVCDFDHAGMRKQQAPETEDNDQMPDDVLVAALNSGLRIL